MVHVLASTRTVPELLDGLARRRRDGAHAGDEWHDAVVRLAGPSAPAEGELVARVVAYLLPLAESLGLSTAAPAAIGRPGLECRVPVVVVFDRATPRPSPDSLSTAELVVDLVGGPERAEPDLEFFGRWRVREHLAIDVATRSITLRRAGADGWVEAAHSQVLGFDVVDARLVSLRGTFAA